MTIAEPLTDADINFYFDPLCPFAWMTSKWVRLVADQRDYRVDWRFISLRMINSHIDYDSHFPSRLRGRPHRRTSAAAGGCPDPGRVRPRGRRPALRRDRRPRLRHASRSRQTRARATRARADFLLPALAEAGLPPELADALDDDSFDAELRAETDEALSLTGKDVGTPIIHFEPPTGVAFFGPVISRLPSPADAAQLWDHVIGLAGFPGFAELKRSLRERPQLASFGVAPDEAGIQEDWHGGSRRQKK